MSITIRHTPADGTLVEGTARGDGTAPILKSHGFRWFRTLGLWGIPGSRDRQPNTYKIDQAAAALRAAGHAVEVDVDTGHRDAAEVEADRAARAEARADALAAKADRKTAAADAAWEADRRATDVLPPMGQPILIGHHSEQRHRNQIERARKALGKAVEASQEAREAARRAEVAAKATQHRYNPVTVKNRIDRFEAEQRRDDRELAGATGDRRQMLTDRMAQRANEIAYWTGVYRGMQADGTASTLSRDNVKPGDLVKLRSTWYRVHRANPKTVSIKLHGEGVTFTNTVGYHELSGHRPAEAES